MIGKSSYKCCYSCDACIPSKSSCRRKNVAITDLFEPTACGCYNEYPLGTCVICGQQFRSITAHLKSHKLTLSQYKIILQKNKVQTQRRMSVWERK